MPKIIPQAPESVAIAGGKCELEGMNQPVEKTSLSRLLDPLFLLALALLLLNDHWWKGLFHNFFTGKLSDFAGLYALAWVCLSLCGPRLGRMRSVHLGLLGAIGVAFALWKSPWSEPILVGWNALDLLPLQRVVDYGDWAAIAVLPFASRRFLRGGPFNWGRLRRMQHWKVARMGFPMGILGLSIFAFCATSSKNDVLFDKDYDFEMPPSEVIRQLNALSVAADLSNLPLSLHHENANLFEPIAGDSIYRHQNHVPTQYADTIFSEDDPTKIKEIRWLSIPEIDTMYVNPHGMFQYSFRLRGKTEPGKNLRQCEIAPATLRLVPKGGGSKLSLLRIELLNCDALPENDNSLSAEAYLEKRFVEEVLDYLNKH